jgi:hypothetical protein
MNFVCIDPGRATGCAISSLIPFGNLIEVGTIRDNGSIEKYCDALRKMKERHDIQFAVIEKYQNFGKYFVDASTVQAEIRACQDVFPRHIMVATGQWNPRHFQDKYKRLMAASTFRRTFTNSHTTDAAMILNWFCQLVIAWAQYAGLSRQDMVATLADVFHAVPKQGKFIVWVDEHRREEKEKQPRFAAVSL